MCKELKKEDLIKQARREYHKKWREKNKDKIKQYNQNYWARRAEKLKGAAANE